MTHPRTYQDAIANEQDRRLIEQAVSNGTISSINPRELLAAPFILICPACDGQLDMTGDIPEVCEYCGKEIKDAES